MGRVPSRGLALLLVSLLMGVTACTSLDLAGLTGEEKAISPKPGYDTSEAERRKREYYARKKREALERARQRAEARKEKEARARDESQSRCAREPSRCRQQSQKRTRKGERSKDSPELARAKERAEQKARLSKKKAAAAAHRKRCEQLGTAALRTDSTCAMMRLAATRTQLKTQRVQVARPYAQTVRYVAKPAAGRTTQGKTGGSAAGQGARTQAAAPAASLRYSRPRATTGKRSVPPADCVPSVFGACPEVNESLVSDFPGTSTEDAPGYASTQVASRGVGPACGDVVDEFDMLVTWDVLANPGAHVTTESGRISRAGFESLQKGRFALDGPREEAGIAFVQTTDGNLGKLLYRFDTDEAGEEFVVLVDATVYTHEREDGAPRVWAPIVLGAGDAVDLDIPDAGAEGLGEEVDVAVRVDEQGSRYLEAVNAAGLEFPTASLCPVMLAGEGQ